MRDIAGIIGTYGAGLARVAMTYEANPALREDLVQEILFAIHRALPALRDGASEPAFVFRIAHNRGVTHALRQRGRRLRDLAAAQDEPEPPATPEGDVLAADRAARLQAAVRRLPLGQRQAVALLLEDLSYAEIAEALGLSLSNVGVRINRAKAALREMLGDG